MSVDNNWERIEAIFTESLAVPESDRIRFVRERSGDDSAVCSEVLMLLGSREKMGDFLEAPMLDFRGQSFGAYRAIQEIGRGGMSAVYLGERVDGDFEKRVAIKVVLLQSNTRLRQSETQILATLDHPNVTRLLDSGATELGFRYLVMEYVEGVPCTAYCAGLSEERKLRVFLQVCAGVQYAHRSLIVHRDLKPDNILVTGDGTAKLLDFGIAKILSQETAGPQTTGVRAYTADYASPEQILGQPVTTSADIFSLGVLLCELIGGRTPRSLSDKPPAELIAAAQKQEIENVPLVGDLAVIARKAMRLDPAERYASASELAGDVERYLHHMPIDARAPSWSYRAGKFIARNRYAAGAACLGVLALTVATGVALWQARQAGIRFEQVRRLSRSVMFELHDAVSPLPGSLAARKLIVDRSLEYLDALARDTNASAEVQLDVARGYLRLADIQGKDFGGASLGRSGEALAAALRAVEVTRRVVATNPGSRDARQVLIDALDHAASAHLNRGEAAKAVPLAKEAVAKAEQLFAETRNDREDKERLATVTKKLAEAYFESQARKEAIPFFERALVLRTELHAVDPADRRRQQRLAEAHHWLSTAQWWNKEFEKAEFHAREAYRLDKLRYAADPKNSRMNLSGDVGLLANLAIRANRMDEAVALFEEQLQLRREVLAEDPKNVVAAMRVASTLDRIGNTFKQWGKYPDAIRYGEQALQQMRPIRAADPGNVVANRELIYSMVDLAESYHKAGNSGRACGLAQETQRLMEDPPKGVQPNVNRHVAKAASIAAKCPPRLEAARNPVK